MPKKRKPFSRTKLRKANIPVQNIFVPEISCSYELTYYVGLKSQISIRYKQESDLLIVHADYRIPQETVHRFVLSKLDLISSWKKTNENRIRLTPPRDAKSSSFKNSLITRANNLLTTRGYDGKLPTCFKVSVLKTCWGKCSSKGEITISAYCHYLPDDLFYYILVHECSHLTHMNHQSKFWNLVGLYVPDYKYQRSLLKKYILESYKEA